MTQRELHPLSQAQLGIWFAQMLGANKSSYNIGEAIEILGPLQPAIFEKALRGVVDATDALHLTFLETDDGPRQFLAPERDWPLRLIDVSGESDPTAAAAAWMREEMDRVVDVSRDSQFDFALLRIAADRFIWYSRYHHLCIDGYGIALVARRVAARYSNFAAGNADGRSLPSAGLESEASSSWLDLLHQEVAYEQSDQCGRDREYWKSQTVDRPQRITLSGRPPSWPEGVICAACEVPSSLVSGLRSVAERCRASLSQVFITALAIYIRRLSGASEFSLGMSLQRSVGMISNVLPLRLEIDPARRLGALVDEVKRRALGAHTHQRYRKERLRRDLGLESGEPEIFGPIVNVCSLDYRIAFAGHPVRIRKIGNWRVDDLEVVVYDRQDGSDVSMQFCANPRLYTPQELEAHQRRFVRLLSGIASGGPDTIANGLNLLVQDEEPVLRETFNAAPETYPRGSCLHTLFEEQVGRSPDSVALRLGTEALTYGELNARANQLAHLLLERGVRPDALVALCMERSFEMLVAILGVLKAGGAYLPIDPSYPADRVRYLLQDSGSAIVLTQQALAPKLPSGERACVALDAPAIQRLLAGCPQTNPDPTRLGLRPQHLAYVIYTSGSTGEPKGVMVEHRNVTRLFDATRAEFEFGPRDVWTLFHSYAFDFSVWEIWGALLHGGTLILVPYTVSRSPSEFHVLLRRERVTVLNQTPSAFLQLMEEDEAQERLPSLRCVIFGGEALDLGALAPWVERYGESQPRLVNMYGITETTVHATYRLLRRADILERPGASLIGRPLRDLSLWLLSEAGEIAPIGVPGEIHVGGGGVARGYLNRPELTSQRFIPHPFVPGERLYRSGDRARYRQNGELEYLGRNDQQVKIRGYRIELQEIEAQLAGCGEVKAAAVVAREDAHGEKRLVAYVVGERDTGRLREALRERLPEYMIPAIWVSLDRLPLTPNGKLDRRALPAALGPGQHGGVTTGAAFRAPHTSAEELLAAIWAEALGAGRVGVDDDFFDLGGDSLSAVRMFAQIRKAFGKNLPLGALFAAPTIAQLARTLQQHASDGPWSSLRAITPAGPKPPLFVVPGIGGNVVSYYDLARRLGPEQPVYGLESRGLDGMQKPLTRIRDIAARFVCDIRTVQPRGPYLLGGACIGGIVALEMAQQLIAAGDEVALLAMFDTWPPSVYRAAVIPQYAPPFLSVPVSLGKGLGRLPRALLHLPVNRWLDHLSKRLESALEIVASRNVYQADTAALYTDLVSRSNYWAMFKYFPKPYAGEIVLFLAAERPSFSSQDAATLWRNFARGGCRVQSVGGTDSGVMLSKPYVEQLASALQREIERAIAERTGQQRVGATA